MLAGCGEFVRERARGELQEACGRGVVEAVAVQGGEHGLLVLAEPREGELEVGDADVAGVRVALAPLTVTGVSVMDDAAGTEQGAVR